MLCLRFTLRNAALTQPHAPRHLPVPAPVSAVLSPRSTPALYSLARGCLVHSQPQSRTAATVPSPPAATKPSPSPTAQSLAFPSKSKRAAAPSPATPHAVASKASSDAFVHLVATAAIAKAARPEQPAADTDSPSSPKSSAASAASSKHKDKGKGNGKSNSTVATKGKQLAKASPKSDLPPKNKPDSDKQTPPLVPKASNRQALAKSKPSSPPPKRLSQHIVQQDVVATKHLSAPAPVIEPRKPLSDQEIQDLCADIVRSIEEGKPGDVLQHFSRLPPFANLPVPIAASLAKALSACPTPLSDPRPDWDRIMEIVFNPMLDHLKSRPPSKSRSIPEPVNAWISIPVRLATALGNRGHARYSPLVDSWCTLVTTSSLLQSAQPATSPLHKPVTGLLTQLIRACASTGSTPSLKSLAASIPDSLYTRDLMRTLLKAHSTLRQPTHFWSTLLDAHKRQLIPYPYIDEAINVQYLAAFTDAHAALAALTKMLAHVNKHHGTPLGDYLEPAILSPDLFATVLNLCREQDNRALVDDVLALAEANHVPWTTAKARAAMMAFHCQVGDWPAAIDMFKGAWSPDHPIDPNEDMLAYAMVAFGSVKDHAMLDKTFAYALEAHRNKKVVLSSTFMVRAFKAIRTCFGWQVAVNKARDLHAATGYLPELVISILQRIASEHQVSLDFVPDLRADSYVHVQQKVGMLAMHMDRLAQAEKLLDVHVPRFADNVEARTYMCMPLLAAFASVPDVVSMERIVDRHIPDYHQCELAEDRQRIAGVLFKGYALNNNYTRCLALWQYLTSQGTAPHPSIQAMVLDACGYMNRVDHLDDIVGLLERQPWGGCDINVWTSAVEAYLRLLRLDRALHVATRIVPNKGLEPNKKFVGVLLTVRRDANRTLDSKAVAKYLSTLSPKLVAEVRRDLRERGAL